MKTVFAVYILLIITAVSGWIMNLCHVVGWAIFSNIPLDHVTVRMIIEIIGIPVAPLGSVMGWVHLFF